MRSSTGWNRPGTPATICPRSSQWPRSSCPGQIPRSTRGWTRSGPPRLPHSAAGRHRGAANDSLLPDQFKRNSKAGVPAFGIIGSASVASIAMIFNYLGSTGTTVLATPVLMTVHLRDPVRLLRTCAAEMALDRPPRPPDTALGLRHGRRRHLPQYSRFCSSGTRATPAQLLGVVGTVLPSTAAAIRVVTCGGAVESGSTGAAASRSCVCDDNTIEGGCCRQDRCRAGPAEAG